MAQRAHASSNVSSKGERSVGTMVDGLPARPLHIEPRGGHRLPRARGCLRCDVRHLVLCAALKEDELPLIEAIVSVASLEPGQTLFGEGDPVCHAYNVAAGTLRLFKLLPDGRRQITGFALAGDFVGLSAGGSHPYGAEAVDRVELCQFPLQGLDGLLARFPEMEHRLLEMRASELVAAQDRMMLLGRKTPVEKIATFLLETSARQKNWGRAASPVILPMTRGDIADYLGLTVETVSRCFTRLKGDGAIALPEPTSVVLLDGERLQRLATASGTGHAAL